jgi:hypothetical protein
MSTRPIFYENATEINPVFTAYSSDSALLQQPGPLLVRDHRPLVDELQLGSRAVPNALRSIVHRYMSSSIARRYNRTALRSGS